MKDFMERTEAGLQNLVERTLERLTGGRLDAAALAVLVVRAMEESLRRDRAGRFWAPDEFDLLLRPADLELMLSETPDLKVFLQKTVVQAARESGYSIAVEPRIAFEVDAKLARNKVRVHAFHSKDTPAHTRQMPSLARAKTSVGAAGASLVGIEGEVYSLELDVVNIGRLPENQIAISDPRVSRKHAQVRLREGHHVIFDLGSKAGTRVNGTPTMECVLQHGDVVTFAGNRLVYQRIEAAHDAASAASDPGAGS
jgi:hypothetical protein